MQACRNNLQQDFQRTERRGAAGVYHQRYHQIISYRGDSEGWAWLGRWWAYCSSCTFQQGLTCYCAFCLCNQLCSAFLSWFMNLTTVCSIVNPVSDSLLSLCAVLCCYVFIGSVHKSFCVMYASVYITLWAMLSVGSWLGKFNWVCVCRCTDCCWIYSISGTKSQHYSTYNFWSNTGWQNSFNTTISRIFAAKRSLHITPHLKHVTTLPCEILMSEN